MEDQSGKVVGSIVAGDDNAFSLYQPDAASLVLDEHVSHFLQEPMTDLERSAAVTSGLEHRTGELKQ